MKRAAVLLVAGAAMFAAARFASASPPVHGVFRAGFAGSSVGIDPQAAYISIAWWLEYATAAKLYNYPDKRGPAGSLLRPEVASSFSVSHDGRTYTFRIRKGFRFSDGSPVTAKNFKYAIDRFANHDLAVSAEWLLADEIVGMKDVHNGNALHVRGVVAKGDRLVIHLTKRDGAFLSKITMPVFQATSTKLPLSREVTRPYPSAGPYAFTRNDVDSRISIRRNRYWTRGPGRQRPQNLAGVDVLWGLDEQTAFQQLRAGELDEVPGYYPAGIPDLKPPSNFRSEPQNCTGFLALNMANHVFRDNLPLRQAVNYAINRRAYVAQAGPYAGQPWTHIFNPGVPGWRKVTLYRRNLAKARRLAAGHLRDGKITMYYRGNSTANHNQAQIVRQDLINLGFEPENITMKGFSGGGPYDPYQTRGNDADIAVSRGWCSDYPDPYDWINVLFDGNTIQAQNNTNASYMNLPKWNRRMEAAARLVGPKRFKVYGQLDLDLMREVAPVAVERTYNNRYWFSNRVNQRSLVYQGIYFDWSIPALALK